MPLAKGKSKSVISKNIGEMMRDYKHGDGKIGNVKPKNTAHAAKIAAAAAFAAAGKSKKVAKKGKKK